MCDALSVSRSGYYAWRSRPESLRKAADRGLLGDIRRVHAHHRERYGAPRIHAELRAKGHTSGSSGYAPAWYPGSGATPLSRVHDREQAFPARGGKPARSEFCGRPAQSGLAGRYQLHHDRRRLALPGRDPRSLHPQGGWLGDARPYACGFRRCRPVIPRSCRSLFRHDVARFRRPAGSWVLARSDLRVNPFRLALVGSGAGCPRRDRCDGRCARGGRGWRRHRSGCRSPRAICRRGPGW